MVSLRFLLLDRFLGDLDEVLDSICHLTVTAVIDIGTITELIIVPHNDTLPEGDILRSSGKFTHTHLERGQINVHVVETEPTDA